MKRSILFASLSLMSLIACAQSSVTLFGEIKAGVAVGNKGTTPLDGSSATDKTALNDYSSVWGLSGKEDLGGGMYAGFDLVSFFNLDSGTLGGGGALFDSRALVKLGGGFGEISFGRALTPASLFVLFADPWYWDGSAAQVGWQIHQANYLSTGFLRTNNTIRYASPNLGGLTFNLAFSPSEKAKGASDDIGASIKYAAGPLWIGAAYDQSNGFFLTPSPTKNHVALVAGSYDFGVIKPMATFTSSEVDGRKYKSYSVAATAPVGPNGLLKASYGHLDDFDTSTVAKEGLNRYSFGYQHNLSKRTNLFAQFSQAKAKTRTATNTFEFGINHNF
jgi:predicted porin